jgi:hypothetical protein
LLVPASAFTGGFWTDLLGGAVMALFIAREIKVPAAA